MKNSVKIRISIIVILIAVMVAVTAVFALFTNEKPFDLAAGSGEVAAVFSEVDISGQTVFSNKGDIYQTAFAVENSGDTAFDYSLELTLTKGGLENAVLLYIDGEFVGTLGQLFAENEKLSFDIGTPLYPGEKFSHKVALEYHLGAGDYYSLPQKDFSLKISGMAKQLFRDEDKIIFVRNNYELDQILANFDYSGYTLRLANDITLTSNLIIDKPLNIDLAGYDINCAGFSISFDYEEVIVSRLFSSKPSTKGIYDGHMSVDTPSAIVINEGAYKGSSYQILSASYTVFKTAFQDHLNIIFANGVKEGVLNIEGKFSPLTDYFGMSFSSSDTDIISGAYAVTAPVVTQYVTLEFVFSSSDVLSFEVQVWGGADAAVEQIIQQNFYFLEGNFSSDYVSQISGDILLPTRVRNFDANILWISSDRETLNENGKYKAPYNDTTLELSAVISVNGKNVLRTFKLTAVGKTPFEKLHEMCQTYVMEHGALNFVYEGQIRLLPVASHYPFMQGAVVDFDLPDTVKDFFGLDKTAGELSLISDDVAFTSLLVTADFDGIVVSDKIDIQVNVLKNITYWEAAYQYLLTFVDDLDDNLLDGFAVPKAHKNNVTIVYDIPLGAFGIYYNPLDVGEYVKIGLDGGNIQIIKEKLPPQNTPVTIRATITYLGNNVSEERFFTFTVGGVLHYSENCIADINLYQELRKIYDTNDDWYITVDEVDNSVIDSIEITNHGIQSIKGLEYFSGLKNIDLSGNKISDISPLSAFPEATTINLSDNNILNISSLKNLTRLESLNLSDNGVASIESLKDMRALTTLYLDNNALLSDYFALEQLISLKTLTAYNTKGALEDAAKNESYFITAYRNALLKYDASEISIKFNTTSNMLPSNNQIEANKILNFLKPIYEFQNVIYLPQYIDYGAFTNIPVEWWTDKDDIIQIVGDRAYITQPVADTRVALSATIIYNNQYTLKRFFDVLSISNDPELKIFNGVTEISASVIKDETLRYKLFEIFDFDGNKTIDSVEIATQRGDINLMSMGITDLSGLEYFAAAIIKLDLRNNAYTDLTPLQSLTNLTELYINNSSSGLLALENAAIDNLTYLSVYGLNNVNTSANLSILYNVYLHNPGITIYKDSLSYVWDPYVEPMTKALTKLQSNYLLYAGEAGRISDLAGEIEVVMYNGDKQWVPVSYARDRGSFSLQAGPSLYLNYNAMPSRDDYGLLNTTITIATTVVTRKLIVISVSDTNMYLEVSSGVYELLTTAVPNESARRAFIARLSNSSAPPTTIIDEKTVSYIPISRYFSISGITFNAMGMSGVKGIEYLKGSTTLTQITYNGYVSPGANAHFGGGGYLDLSLLNATDYPNLVTLTLNNSVVNLFELSNMTQLNTLSVSASAKIVMDKVEGSVRISAFAPLTGLTRLNLHNNNIRDFWAITHLVNVTTLTLYGNGEHSVSALTNSYVEQAYANLPLNTPINYQVTATNVLWQSSLNRLEDLGVIINGSIVAKPTFLNVNYVGKNYRATLPLRYKSQSNNVVWTASRGANAYTYSEAGATATIVFKNPAVATYVVLVGTVSNFLTLEYVFVVQQTKTNKNYLKLSDFMKNGEIADPSFTYYMLNNVVADEAGNGIYNMATIRGVSTIDQQAQTNASVSYVFTDIRGIKNFTGVSLLNLSNHSISNIEELYDLINLQTLRLFNNVISSLTNAASGNSVFYKMSVLSELQLQDNPSILDFYPIAERQNSAWLQNLATINIYQSSTSYAPSAEDEDAANNKNIFNMVRAWWAQRKNVTATQASLTFISGQKISDNGALNELVFAMNALDAVQPKMDVVTGSTLGASVTIDVPQGSPSSLQPRSYSLAWTRYGSNSGITITSAGIIESITAEASFSNRKLKVMVSTVVYGTSYTVSKLVNIGLDIESNLEDDTLLVEITHAERIGRFSALAATLVIDDAVAANRVYTVSAADVIPDSALRNYIFYRFDKTPFGTISLAERNTSVNYIDASSRGIVDISGIDLFPRGQRWILTSNRIVSLPKLYITAASTIYELTLYRNVFLRDISQLGFTGGTGYVSIGSKLTYLDLRECASLDDNQTAHFSQLTALTRINLNGMRIGDYSALQSLYKTLATLWIDNYRTNANNNHNKIRKLVADSYNAVPISAVNGLSIVLQPFVDTSGEYAADGITQHALPTGFKIPYYAKQYSINWAVPVGETTYSINKVGDIFYLTITPQADAVITLNATATYFDDAQRNTYTESFQLITSKLPNFDNLYDRMQGEIWSRFTNEYVDIESVMPDPILRYYFFKKLDTDGDGKISAAELGEGVAIDEILFNEGSPYISSLEGIEYIINVNKLNVSRGYTYDYSRLQQLSTLKELTINNNLVTLYDTSFLDGLSQLQRLNLNSSGVINYGFLMDNASIVEMLNISQSTRSTARFAMFNRIAWAFARMYNNFSDDASAMGDSNAHESVADEKYASIVLHQIKGILQEDSFYRIDNIDNEIALPQQCNFGGQTYAITWQSLSSNIVINGETATVLQNHYDTELPLIARIDYNNGSYEKLFIVRYAQ